MERLTASGWQRPSNEIIARHEVLRTTFASSDGEVVQVVHASLPLTLREETVAGDDALAEAIRHGIYQPFDLVRGPLLRAALFADAHHADAVLVLTLHHIVADGWSLGVLVREFSALYAAFVEGRRSPLPELPLQYADYVEWQREQEPRIAAELSYWTARLASPRATVTLPVDRTRPPAFSYKGATITHLTGREQLDMLRALASARGATLFMVLLAALKVLLYRYARETDLVVGSPVANRRLQHLEGLVGFFANTLVLRTDLSGHPSFNDAIGRVRETALAPRTSGRSVRPDRGRARSPT